MPRVLRIINRLNIGGPTYNVAYLSRYMAPAFDTLLVSGMIDETEGSSQFMLDRLGLQPRYVQHMHRNLHPRHDYKAYRELRQIIREYKPDIVHTHAAKAGALGRLAAIHAGVPVVLHTFHGHVFHSYFGSAKTQFYLSIERYLAKRSAGVIAISESQQLELGQQYRVCDPSRIFLVPNGFDLERFYLDQETKRAAYRQQWGLAPDVLAVGIIGRLVPVKNHELFFRAFARLKASHSGPVRALVIGDGELRTTCETLCTQLGLSFTANAEPADVVFTSWTQEVDVALAGLDIVALTSLNEGTPVSLIEAQAAARAIASTSVGGVADTVRAGSTALLSPSLDVEGFAANLLTLAQNPAQREAMGAEGRVWALQRYGYQRLVSDMQALYQRLLANKP